MCLKLNYIFRNSEDLYFYMILKGFLVQDMSRIKFLSLESEEKMKKNNTYLKDFKKDV